MRFFITSQILPYNKFNLKSKEMWFSPKLFLFQKQQRRCDKLYAHHYYTLIIPLVFGIVNAKFTVVIKM
ncbi:MAG TPA: hypothetical protein DD391_03170 [Clostridiales bacterium]|nr:hypothetical protein [Clostridiales bacterium]HBL81588.1 hypothetical protein [Clostridiales bacterium]